MPREAQSLPHRAHPTRQVPDPVAHVQLCWLSLLLIRTAVIATGQIWRNLAHDLDRIRLVTLATDAGTVAQRTRLDEKLRSILGALDLPEPPRYYDFSPLHG